MFGQYHHRVRRMIMNEQCECNWSPYSCQSLLGYGRLVHERSGGICAWCGLGKDAVDFDHWRQFSVDHVIPTNALGEKGWAIFSERFPCLPDDQLKLLYQRINEINLVTACNFCNSMTSRMRIEGVDGIVPATAIIEVTSVEHPAIQEMLAALDARVSAVLEDKREYVQARLTVLRSAFDRDVRTTLVEKRNASE
jgi:hypothetical protein